MLYHYRNTCVLIPETKRNHLLEKYNKDKRHIKNQNQLQIIKNTKNIKNINYDNSNNSNNSHNTTNIQNNNIQNNNNIQDLPLKISDFFMSLNNFL